VASILFVRGDDDHARDVYRTQHRGYWAAALPLALEKHGLLGIETAPFSALADPTIWSRYAVVLVARAPNGIWNQQLAELAAGGSAGVVVEGPVPAEVAAQLGIAAEPWPHRDGAITPVNAMLEADAVRYGHRPLGRVQRPITRPVNREPSLAWRSIDAVGISERRAAAWQELGWDVQRWTLEGDGEVLADWISENPADRWPAVVVRDRLVGVNFGLFAYLGQRHTSEPFNEREHRMSARSLGLEILLLAVIDRLHRAAGRARARVLPWPSEVNWVRGVRHDFDRPLAPDRVAEVLDGHARTGTVATWYWRSRHAPSEALSAVLGDRAHEIALHTERPWIDADTERAQLERCTGASMRGSSAHGAPDCFGYQGAPNLLWAEAAHLDYSECIQHAHLHPHRFATLGEDGVIAPLELLCLPHHESFDRSTTHGDTLAERLMEVLPTWTNGSGFIQVMNHPDLHPEHLFRLLADMPAEGRADWRACDVVDWWSATHRADRVAVRPRADGGFSVSTSAPVSGLVVEVLAPDGGCREHVLDVDVEEPVTVSVAL
jgi:hypothetical protein